MLVVPRLINRRSFLAGTLATAALAGSGCARSVAEPPAVNSLVADDPFYIAHRGGGGNWPEMTAYAYQQAAKVPGLKALEISVCLTADNVLVCSHDPTTTRMTGVSYTIAEQTWQTLSELRVSAAESTNPSQPPRPFTRFDDVVEAYSDRFVLFVEPKVSPAGDPLMRRMEALGLPERVVWKQPINSRLFSEAKRRGFTTWGYVLNEAGHLGDNLTRFAAAPEIDMLGAPQGESETFITDITQAAASNGKKTIAWPIRNPADRARVITLGVSGMMTSRLIEVMNVTE